MAKDVQLNINAKDAASRVLEQVAGNVRGLKNTMNTLTGAVKGVQSAFVPLLGVFAAIKGVQAVFDVIGSSNEAYKTQEAAARSATEAQKEFAAELQKSLGVGDEVSLQMMRQAELLGISKESTDEAAVAAIGLAKATGRSQKEALEKINQVMQGNVATMGELVPAIKDVETEQEKLALINDMVSRGLEEQKQAYSGLEGVQARASNSLGDLLEVIGNILAPIRMVVSQGIAVFAEVLQQSLAPAVEMANAAMENMPAILQWVSEAVIAAVTFIEVGITNLPAIFELVTAKIQLTWLQLSESAKHVFTGVIPQYLAWFSDNWVNLIIDAGNAVLTYVANYTKRQFQLFELGFQIALDTAEWFANNLPTILANFGRQALEIIKQQLSSIGEAFATAWDGITAYFMGGGSEALSTMSAALSGITDKVTSVLAEPPSSTQGYAQRFAEIMSQDLMAGFESTVTPLPEVIGRQITEGEISLQEKIGRIGADLGSQFNDKFGDRIDSITGKVQDFTAKLGGDLFVDAKVKAEGSQQQQQLQATEGRLLTRGREENPIDQVVTNGQKTNDMLAKLITATEKNKPPKPVKQEGLKGVFVGS